ncbi:hypothetical protein PM082_009575 [Marasmius tenuissimus]|nr:hypothetical protein PM082_015310 [Marasmius tenuissimus]KAJ8093715.1 hypothetical protein PM082_009575 [Marasmius tenuissimus]
MLLISYLRNISFIQLQALSETKSTFPFIKTCFIFDWEVLVRFRKVSRVLPPWLSFLSFILPVSRLQASTQTKTQRSEQHLPFTLTDLKILSSHPRRLQHPLVDETKRLRRSSLGHLRIQLSTVNDNEGIRIVRIVIPPITSSRPKTKPMGTAAVPAFSISCFSVSVESPYESTYIAESFDDEYVKLWLKTHAAIEKGISTSEGKGFVYVFRIDGVDFSDVTDLDLSNTVAYKVRRTVDPERRERQWQQQCPSQKHTWFPPVPVKHCHYVERLVHTALEEMCVLRPRKACSDCGCVHHEIFLMLDVPGTVENVITPLVDEGGRIALMAEGK